MSGINLKQRLKTAGILIPIVWAAAIFPGSWFIINFGMLLLCLIGIFMIFVKLYSYNKFLQRNDNILLELFGLIFISGISGFGYLFYFQQQQFILPLKIFRPKFIAVIFCLAWQADNGGLFFGSAFGRKPFAQSISPKKTTEGILGAFILCFLSALLMWVIAHYWSDFLYVKISFLDYAILGAVNGVLAIMSDLIESFMKRCSMVKDSGTFFPGHGGFFDRLDSILLPLPFTYWYMSKYLTYTYVGQL
eukprot:403368703